MQVLAEERLPLYGLEGGRVELAILFNLKEEHQGLRAELFLRWVCQGREGGLEHLSRCGMRCSEWYTTHTFSKNSLNSEQHSAS